MTRVFKEVHVGVCGKHQGDLRLFKQLIHLGYYWPTVEADTTFFARKCQACNLTAMKPTSLKSTYIACAHLSHYMGRYSSLSYLLPS